MQNGEGAEELAAAIDKHLSRFNTPSIGYIHWMLGSCSTTAKFDVVARAFQVVIPELFTCRPFLHFLVREGYFDNARHFIMHYDVDLEAKDYYKRTLVQDLSIYTDQYVGSLRFLEWLVARTNVIVDKPTDTHKRSIAAVEVIERALKERQPRQAMQTLVQGDRPRHKCRGAVNRSFFRHRLFERHMVKAIAGFLY